VQATGDLVDKRLDGSPEERTNGMQSALSAQDIEPCANETADRIATGLVTIVPFLALGVVVWQVWESLLHWHDFVVFGVIYVLTGLGITVGFHRYFTHRAFKTNRVIRGTLAILGTAAIEGPITAWVADHRKHHAFSDQVGDPHSRTSTTAEACAARCAASPTRISAGCSCTPSAPTRRATRPTSSRTR
jgi:fatty acid desaturase